MLGPHGARAEPPCIAVTLIRPAHGRAGSRPPAARSADRSSASLTVTGTCRSSLSRHSTAMFASPGRSGGNAVERPGARGTFGFRRESAAGWSRREADVQVGLRKQLVRAAGGRAENAQPRAIADRHVQPAGLDGKRGDLLVR